VHPRRGQGVEVIAAALAQRLRGAGPRAIGERLGVPADTVRGWIRRVTQRAEQLRSAATGHLHLLDPAATPPEPTGSDLGDALAALAAAARAAFWRLGPRQAGQGPAALLGRLGLSTPSTQPAPADPLRWRGAGPRPAPDRRYRPVIAVLLMVIPTAADGDTALTPASACTRR
jgi:hypothetical protein